MCMQDIAIAMNSTINILTTFTELPGTGFRIPANPNRIGLIVRPDEDSMGHVRYFNPETNTSVIINDNGGAGYGEVLYITKYGKIIQQDLYFNYEEGSSFVIEILVPPLVMQYANNMFMG